MTKEEKAILNIVPFLELIPMDNQLVIEDAGTVQFCDDVIFYTIEILN